MFVADEKTVEPLAYDFSKFGGGAGRIPEPNTDQIVRFWSDYAAHITAISKESLDDTVEGEPVDNYERSMANRARLREIVSEVCSGTPSAEDINKLPGRHQGKFITYIQSALTPEG